ncbi:GlxA family transcriptional regulator [Arenibacterium sp. CAU 1754]
MKSAKNILTRSDSPLTTAVLVLDNCNTLSFAAGVDPMRAANRLSARTLFRWSYVTPSGRPATLTSGLTVPGAPIARLERCDLLLVIAGFGIDQQATPALLASLRRIAGTGATIAGIDGGPWLMARAGLLDNHRASPHWEDLDRFATEFPAVTTLRDRFHINGARMTSGGATPAIDMMLHLIGTRYGTGLAGRVAGAFIYDSPPDPARAQRRIGAQPSHSTLTARASALMQDTIDTPLPIPALARQIGTSARTLQAQFQARLRVSPQAHYLTLRLEEAFRLVRDTDMPLTDVALATGFASQSAFARAFRATHGQAARSLRNDRQSVASSC